MGGREGEGGGGIVRGLGSSMCFSSDDTAKDTALARKALIV
jgi:hypothetical protein